MNTNLLPKGARGRTEQIADWVASKPGCTIRDACARFKVSTSTVYSACYMHDVKLTRLNAKTEAEPRIRKVAASILKIIAQLQNTRYSHRWIGEDFGITRQAVQQVEKRARAAGIRFPGRKRKQETTYE